MIKNKTKIKCILSFNRNKKLNSKSENERIANNSNELFCKKMDFIFAYV